MTRDARRLARERRTVGAMIELYCRANHPRPHPCSGCAELLEYANRRIDRCPYEAEKPTCANCPIHCYRTDAREQMRAVMRFAGPRMLVHHPILALWHLVDGRREAPDRAARARATS